MKHQWTIIALIFLCFTSCTEKINLESENLSETTRIIFYVSLSEFPTINTLKVYDNYENFINDTLPGIVSVEYTDRYFNTTHEMIMPKADGKELWIRINSRRSLPHFDRNYRYKSSIFMPVSDYLLINAKSGYWIPE